jgi:membrane protein YqaA with SNARE-associated domain
MAVFRQKLPRNRVLRALGRLAVICAGLAPLGDNFASVGIDFAVIWGFIALFFVAAALRFRKKRA